MNKKGIQWHKMTLRQTTQCKWQLSSYVHAVQSWLESRGVHPNTVHVTRPALGAVAEPFGLWKETLPPPVRGAGQRQQPAAGKHFCVWLRLCIGWWSLSRMESSLLGDLFSDHRARQHILLLLVFSKVSQVSLETDLYILRPSLCLFSLKVDESLHKTTLKEV